VPSTPLYDFLAGCLVTQRGNFELLKKVQKGKKRGRQTNEEYIDEKIEEVRQK
jgi:hypothetical protein